MWWAPSQVPRAQPGRSCAASAVRGRLRPPSGGLVHCRERLRPAPSLEDGLREEGWLLCPSLRRAWRTQTLGSGRAPGAAGRCHPCSVHREGSEALSYRRPCGPPRGPSERPPASGGRGVRDGVGVVWLGGQGGGSGRSQPWACRVLQGPGQPRGAEGRTWASGGRPWFLPFCTSASGRLTRPRVALDGASSLVLGTCGSLRKVTWRGEGCCAPRPTLQSSACGDRPRTTPLSVCSPALPCLCLCPLGPPPWDAGSPSPQLWRGVAPRTATRGAGAGGTSGQRPRSSCFQARPAGPGSRAPQVLLLRR